MYRAVSEDAAPCEWGRIVALHKGEGESIYLKILEKEALKTVEQICRKNVKYFSRRVFRLISSAVGLEGKV